MIIIMMPSENKNEKNKIIIIDACKKLDNNALSYNIAVCCYCTDRYWIYFRSVHNELS